MLKETSESVLKILVMFLVVLFFADESNCNLTAISDSEFKFHRIDCQDVQVNIENDRI